MHACAHQSIKDSALRRGQLELVNGHLEATHTIHGRLHAILAELVPVLGGEIETSALGNVTRLRQQVRREKPGRCHAFAFLG
jgi:hypothetical protein